MNYEEIKSLSYKQAKSIATETLQLKGHDCIIADLGEYFGYSIMVFKDGKHIYYADDFELHHRYMTKDGKGYEKLREFYIEEMNHKLYTEQELLEPIHTYAEYEKKNYFLRNYWIMRHDYVTIFCFGKEQEEENRKARKGFPFLNPISFCYVKDQSIIERQSQYHRFLEKEYKKLAQSDDTFREMICSELSNHEACITGSYEEALEALGMKFEELSAEKQQIVLQELKQQIERG